MSPYSHHVQISFIITLKHLILLFGRLWFTMVGQSDSNIMKLDWLPVVQLLKWINKHVEGPGVHVVQGMVGNTPFNMHVYVGVWYASGLACLALLLPDVFTDNWTMY